MIIVVNDANILIDLIKLNLLPNFFSLDFIFHTNEFIFEELYEDQQEALLPYIDSGILQISVISNEDLIQIFEIKTSKPQLSEQDCSTFLQAQSLKATLLTSDNSLRKYSIEKGLNVHGHLWVFDQMVESKHLSPLRAIEKINELISTINPRLSLPKAECKQRLRHWNNLK